MGVAPFTVEPHMHERGGVGVPFVMGITHHRFRLLCLIRLLYRRFPLTDDGLISMGGL